MSIVSTSILLKMLLADNEYTFTLNFLYVNYRIVALVAHNIRSPVAPVALVATVFVCNLVVAFI